MAALGALNEAVVACRRCPRLVQWREQVAREKRAAFRDQDYWGKPLPKGVHRGIAVVDSYGSFVAAVAEIAMQDPTTIEVKRVVVALDCGYVCHSDAVVAQIEGGVIWGLSALMHEEITIKDGRVEQTNFGDYPLLRLAEAPPKIEAVLVPSGGFCWVTISPPAAVKVSANPPTRSSPTMKSQAKVAAFFLPMAVAAYQPSTRSCWPLASAVRKT